MHCKTDLTVLSNAVATGSLSGKYLSSLLIQSMPAMNVNTIFRVGTRQPHTIWSKTVQAARDWQQLKDLPRQYTSRTTIGMSYTAIFATSYYGFSQWIILCYMSRLLKKTTSQIEYYPSNQNLVLTACTWNLHRMCRVANCCIWRGIWDIDKYRSLFLLVDSFVRNGRHPLWC